ncbi:tetratricopeptide repeat protein [Aureibacillus halotolerans]|uniref:Tetratricopeptide repeat protein n=1 Tax=Aureibacillus halotolerans TaxID=1508390 RepID=A0A4R6TUX6_9BACI|nr:tetratricopeptide repeat protein [Aureibacillus halotolerans]TDQ36976.1 tetratricopeptide repeat protein [Aureibacillus halotolerans]
MSDVTYVENSQPMETTGTILPFHASGKTLFNIASKAMRLANIHKAERYLRLACKREPQETFYQSQLAMCLSELGKYSDSNKVLLELLQVSKQGMEEAYFLLANNYAHLGQFDEALKYTKTYLAISPVGEFSEDAQDLLDVLDEDELEFNEDPLVTSQEEAKELLAKGRFKEAEESFLEIISTYPSFWAAHNNLALALFYQGQSRAAFKRLDTVLEKNPGNLHAICNLAVFYKHLGKQQKLQESLWQLRNVYPMTSDYQYKIGATLAMLGDYQTGFYWLNHLYSRHFEGDALFYHWLSLSAYYTGRNSFAHSVWKLAKRIDPSLSDAEQPWEAQHTQEHKGHMDQYQGELLSGLKHEDLPEWQLFCVYMLNREATVEHLNLEQYPLHPVAEKLHVMLKENVFENSAFSKRDQLMLSVAHLFEERFSNGQQDSAMLLHDVLAQWFQWYVLIRDSKTRRVSAQVWAAAVEVTAETGLSVKDACTYYDVPAQTLKSYLTTMQEWKEQQLQGAEH